MAVADGPEAYSRAIAILGHPLAKMFLAALIWSFWFHFLNGIRHLIWDTGHGFDPKVVRISGWAILLGATVLAGAYSLLMVF